MSLRLGRGSQRCFKVVLGLAKIVIEGLRLTLDQIFDQGISHVEEATKCAGRVYHSAIRLIMYTWKKGTASYPKKQIGCSQESL